METKEVIVDAHPRDITTSDVYEYVYAEGTGCNKLRVYSYTNSSTLLNLYQYSSEMQYAVQYGSGTISSYVNVGTDQYIDVPSIKDSYGKTITLYYKLPCGRTFTKTISITTTHALSIASVCTAGGFFPRVSMNYTNQPICFPVDIKFRNTATNAISNITLTSTSQVIGTTALPAGTYEVTYTTGDGFSRIYTSAWTLAAPTYYINYNLPSSCGIFGRAYFYVSTSTGMVPTGFRVRLKSGPAGYNIFDETNTSTNLSYYYMYYPSDGAGKNKYWIPGTYVWELTDPCSGVSTDHTITIGQDDVYNLTSFSVDASQETCTGLVVKPTATVTAYGSTRTPYFQIESCKVDGSSVTGYDTRIITNGGSFVLTRPGTYRIAVSYNSTCVGDYGYSGLGSTYVDYPNDASSSMSNVITVVYEKKQVEIDSDNSVGYICPEASANSGTILAYGKNGTTPYTFSIAAKGNGNTGPYFETNATGRFTDLILNTIYDIKITDACGASTYKEIKILDLSTAQKITVESSSPYCEGSELKMRVISLDPAVYTWILPDGSKVLNKYLTISNLTAGHTGRYFVEVETELCPGRKIIDSVDIVITRRAAISEITASDVSICSGSTATLTAGNTTITNPKFRWYSDSNLTTLVASNTATYITPALAVSTTYYVTVEGSNVCPNNLGKAVTVTAKPRPTPTIASGSLTVCGGSTETYTTQAGKTGYVWAVVGGTIAAGGGSSNNSVTVKWNNSGTASISVNYTDTNACSAAVATKEIVTIKAAPTPTITTAPATACVGDSKVYSTQTGKYGYVWDVTGGTITSGQGTYSATIQWTAAGIGTVTVGYANTSSDCVGYSAITNVTVNTLPVPTITGSTIVCGNSTETYSTETGMTGYSWTVSGGTIQGSSSGSSVSVKWNASGSGTIAVTYTNTSGCMPASATSKTVTINTLPVPAISGTVNVISGSSHTYTTETSMSDYVWTVTNGTISGPSNGSSVTVIWGFSGAATISVRYKNAAGCNAAVATKKDIVVDVANLILTIAPAKIREGGTGATATVCLPTLIVAPAGGITVTLTSSSSSTASAADYSLAGGGISSAKLPATIAIPAGERCASFTISALADDLVEEDETLIVAASASGFINAQATLTIEDRTDGTIIVKTEKDGTEPGGASNDGKFWIGFKEDVTCIKDVEVSYSLSGSAVEGTDYIDLAPHKVVIPAGSRGIDVDVNIKNNFIVEGTRTVKIVIDAVVIMP